MKAARTKRYLISAGLFAWLISASHVQAAAIPLAWDPPTENEDGTPITDLAGYRLYIGPASGTYTSSVDLGNVNSTTITGLNPNLTYFFAVTAYDSAHEESTFSDELTWTADADADALPDTWERRHFGDTSAPNGAPSEDFDGDGYSNYEEYIAGTSPADPAERALVECVRQGGAGPVVQFAATEATGTAYDGYRRYFALEHRPASPASAWATVPQLDSILGANQTVVYSPPAGESRYWYRTRTWLQ